MAQTESAEREQYLSFTLAGAPYAVAILRVREILQYAPPTRVPSVPAWIRGVMDLRGAVIPVVDLGLKLGLAETSITKRTSVLVVEADLSGERSTMGLLADAVSEVLELGPKDVEPPPAFGTPVPPEYLRGAVRTEDGFVLLLDLERALASELDARPGADAAAAAHEATP
jgi:purine-binding chemotaxis protein CheW